MVDITNTARGSRVLMAYKTTSSHCTLRVWAAAAVAYCNTFWGVPRQNSILLHFQVAQSASCRRVLFLSFRFISGFEIMWENVIYQPAVFAS